MANKRDQRRREREIQALQKRYNIIKKQGEDKTYDDRRKGKKK